MYRDEGMGIADLCGPFLFICLVFDLLLFENYFYLKIFQTTEKLQILQCIYYLFHGIYIL